MRSNKSKTTNFLAKLCTNLKNCSETTWMAKKISIYYIQQPICELLGCPWAIGSSTNCWTIHNAKTQVMRILTNLITVSKMTSVLTLHLHWCACLTSFICTFFNQNLRYAWKNYTPTSQEQVQDIMPSHKFTRLQNFNRIYVKIIKQYIFAKCKNHTILFIYTSI
jgi:hypothetical protein